MADLTPQQVVAELDRYIVGQVEAKRSLAVALRERDRRKKLAPEMRREVGPKNILVIGPTGVGKTELARRLASLIDAPFLKTEATKYTEVGYVGRDVESIIRELAENSVSMVHRERTEEVREEAERLATERLITYLLGGDKEKDKARQAEGSETAEERPQARERAYMKRRRRVVARQLAERELEERVIEIELESDESFASVLEFSSAAGADEVQEQFQEFMNTVSMSRKKSRRMPVREARRILFEQEAAKLVDFDEVVDLAIRRVEDSGIVFIDEIDKLVSKGSDFGPDVSGEGVQRDLLPVVEGAAVATRYGSIQSDNILFVAAGAFTRSRPSDLLPELQGRFPLRVEVKDLAEEDFVRILTEPDNALSAQYRALLETEEVDLQFTDDGIREIAAIAAGLNSESENLGARRLYGVMDKVLEEINFRATEFAGQIVVIDAEYVSQRMAHVPRGRDLSKYIL